MSLKRKDIAKPLLTATRNELDIELKVLEGEIPTNIHGHIYINSAVGSVNSGGLPFPKNHDEFNTPIFNGDGYVIRLDFDNQNIVKLKSRLVKTPSYWADEALKEGGEARKNRDYEGWEYKNLGMLRMSFPLGPRNQANVSVIPVKFDDHEPTRMIATYEAGRAWEIDPFTLEVKAPVGKSTDFLSLVPEWFLRYPFISSLSTAHPVFDAHTKEYFTVSFVQAISTMIGFSRLFVESKLDPNSMYDKVNRALDELILKGEKNQKEIFKTLFGQHQEITEIGLLDSIKDKLFTDDKVRVMRWNGHTNLKKWRVRCNGEDIKIGGCMHQMSVTEDYLILSNSSLKMNLSVMFNNFMAHKPEIEEKIREILSFPMDAHSDLYFIKRADLRDDVEVVSATKARIPLETVHFTANYKNPDGKITLMTANNTANCPAEWIRHFDKKKVSGEPVDFNTLSYLSVGQMDIGRIGRFVFDAKAGKLMDEESSILFEKGNIEQPEHIGKHTWGVGLYTFQGYEEVGQRKDNLENIYWQIFGLDSDLLTEFIYNLYKDYPNRIVSVEQIEELTKQGVPVGIARVDHSQKDLKIEDFYLFELKHYIRSVQFVPRKNRTENLPQDMDGYIVCTVKVPLDSQNPDMAKYTSEIWIWKADNLAKGTVCKLAHEDFDFAYTFHSVWSETAEPTCPKNQIDIIDDIDEMVKSIVNPSKKIKVEAFMDEYVYPHFADQQNQVRSQGQFDLSGLAYKWATNLFRSEEEQIPYFTKFKR